MYKVKDLLKDLEKADPETQVVVELVGDEWEDGDILQPDGDVGIHYNGVVGAWVLKAISNEVGD